MFSRDLQQPTVFLKIWLQETATAWQKVFAWQSHLAFKLRSSAIINRSLIGLFSLQNDKKRGSTFSSSARPPRHDADLHRRRSRRRRRRRRWWLRRRRRHKKRRSREVDTRLVLPPRSRKKFLRRITLVRCLYWCKSCCLLQENFRLFP